MGKGGHREQSQWFLGWLAAFALVVMADDAIREGEPARGEATLATRDLAA
jgi:hypothetical protein